MITGMHMRPQIEMGMTRCKRYARPTGGYLNNARQITVCENHFLMSSDVFRDSIALRYGRTPIKMHGFCVMDAVRPLM